jgi:hypothetical protein
MHSKLVLAVRRDVQCWVGLGRVLVLFLCHWRGIQCAPPNEGFIGSVWLYLFLGGETCWPFRGEDPCVVVWFFVRPVLLSVAQRSFVFFVTCGLFVCDSCN